MRPFPILMTLIALNFTPGFAISRAELAEMMQRGNDAYQAENYQEAVQAYEHIVKQGYVSGELYFNLGNAYYRLGNLGKAIVNYERAKRYLPNSESVNFNLRLANLNVKDRIDVPPEFFLFQWYRQLVNCTTARTWGAFFTGSLFLTALLILLPTILDLHRWQRFSKVLLIICICLTILLAIPMIVRYQYETRSNEAIILSSAVSSLAGPQPGSTELFIIHAGTKVKVLDEDGDWYKIELIDGKQGWIPATDVEKI